MSAEPQSPQGRPWQQDTADYSWTLVDDDDCFYRAARSRDGGGDARWVIAWTEELPRPRVRIGGTFNTAEEAKAAIENIAVFAEGEDAALARMSGGET